MNTKHIVVIVVGILITLSAFGQAEEKATKAAEDWLALIDTEKYAESWEACANLAKNLVSSDQWVQSMKSARKIFGNVAERTLKSSEYSSSLPGAPDGEYVVIQYDTSFEKKKSAQETMTLMLDSDGQWKVSAYYIK